MNQSGVRGGGGESSARVKIQRFLFIFIISSEEKKCIFMSELLNIYPEINSVLSHKLAMTKCNTAYQKQYSVYHPGHFSNNFSFPTTLKK